MGLPFDQQPAAGADPDQDARKERVEALEAAAYRIKDEFATVKERKNRLFHDLNPVLNRIRDDPSSAAASELDGFIREAEEIVDKLRALIPVSVAFDTGFEALEYQEGLAAHEHGQESLADGIEDVLKSVQEFNANMRSLADWISDRAAVSSTDASAD